MQADKLAYEVKFATDDEGVITGLASLWDEPDAYGDVIKKGAFAKTLKEHKSAKTRPLFRYEHRSDEVIGVWDSIAETDAGLEVKGRLVLETQRGREAHALLKAGAISGLSIGFRSRGATRGPNGARILTDIELVEISLVSSPAASRARVSSVKSGTPAGQSLSAFIGALKRANQTLKRSSGDA